ncbi:histone-fold-containing protein [Linnemannia elongata]|nr:histone-fold-containing protein [Linnemannia elongata]
MSEQHQSGDELDDYKEQDRFLPIANVARIMKKALPDNAKIAKEAKETVQECVSEFISFITSEASDRCQLEKRKTINGEDILWAMQSLGFENYAEALKIYLSKYREVNNLTETSRLERFTWFSLDDPGATFVCSCLVLRPTTKQQEKPLPRTLDDGGIFHQQDVNAGYYHQQNGEYSNIH